MPTVDAWLSKGRYVFFLMCKLTAIIKFRISHLQVLVHFSVQWAPFVPFSKILQTNVSSQVLEIW